MYSTLVIPKQSYRKQGPGNYWYEHNVYAISTSANVPISTSIEDIQAATDRMQTYKSQSHNKDEVEQGMQKYWSIRHGLAMINGIAMKAKE